MALFGRKPKTTPKTTQPSVTNTSAAVSVVNAAMENADNGGGGYSLITYSLWTFMFLKN